MPGKPPDNGRLESMLLARRFVTQLSNDTGDYGDSPHSTETRSFKKNDDLCVDLGGRDGNVVVTTWRRGVQKAS